MPKRQLGLVINEELLSSFRVPGYCEVCGRWCNPREPAHIFGRGARSWKRIDVVWNLLSLGSTRKFQCDCHTKHHAGKLSTESLLSIVASREDVTIEWIKAEHDRILREFGKGGISS
jgi:hypothetical protein